MISHTTALHVGAHKTATTHLQQSIAASLPALIERGVQFYGPTALRAGGQSLLARLDQDGVRHDLVQGATRLVLSEENFMGTLHVREGAIPKPLYRNGPDRIAQLADRLAPDGLELFLCIRDPADFLGSAYGQVLMGGKVMPFAAFRDANPLDKVDWVYLARRLSKVAGINQITVWRYEDYLPLFDQICTSMLGVGGVVTPVPKRVHQGLSGQAVDEMMKWHAAGETGALALLARDTYPIAGDVPAFDGFDASDRAASAEKYASQIEKILRIPNVRFLRRSAEA